MTRLLDYPGGKWTLADWIISHIPRSVVHTYNEPFCGSASVLLSNDKRFPMEAINDASSRLVNFFRVFRDNEAELIRAIELTPWATDEYKVCQVETSDQIEDARRFYFHVWASIRPFDSNSSFRRQKVLSVKLDGSGAMTPAARLFSRTDHLWELANRLRGVTVENMDAIDFIKLYDYDRAFFYLDPPYPFHTRKRNALPTYAVEFVSDGRNIEGDYNKHYELSEILHSLKGHAVVSGYACDWYTEFYEDYGWHRVDKDVRVNGGKRMATESLWIHPRTWKALSKKSMKQGILF